MRYLGPVCAIGKTLGGFTGRQQIVFWKVRDAYRNSGSWRGLLTQSPFALTSFAPICFILARA